MTQSYYRFLTYLESQASGEEEEEEKKAFFVLVFP